MFDLNDIVIFRGNRYIINTLYKNGYVIKGIDIDKLYIITAEYIKEMSYCKIFLRKQKLSKIMSKYNIVLKTWHQETPDKTYDEIFNNESFEHIEDAVRHLYDNIDTILDEFPVQEITIKYNK